MKLGYTIFVSSVVSLLLLNEVHSFVTPSLQQQKIKVSSILVVYDKNEDENDVTDSFTATPSKEEGEKNELGEPPALWMVDEFETLKKQEEVYGGEDFLETKEEIIKETNKDDTTTKIQSKKGKMNFGFINPMDTLKKIQIDNDNIVDEIDKLKERLEIEKKFKASLEFSKTINVEDGKEMIKNVFQFVSVGTFTTASIVNEIYTEIKDTVDTHTNKRKLQLSMKKVNKKINNSKQKSENYVYTRKTNAMNQKIIVEHINDSKQRSYDYIEIRKGNAMNQKKIVQFIENSKRKSKHYIQTRKTNVLNLKKLF